MMARRSKKESGYKKRVSPDLALGGLDIPHPEDIITGFQQNLIQRILQKNTRQIPSVLPDMLEGLLYTKSADPLFTTTFSNWDQSNGEPLVGS